MTLEEVKIKSDEYFGLDLSNKTRIQSYIDARCFYYKFCRTYFYEKSYRIVGKLVGSHHATVIHGINRFDCLFMYDKEYQKRYTKYEDFLIKEFKLKEELPEFINDIEKELIIYKRKFTYYKNKYKKSQRNLNNEKTKLILFKQRKDELKKNKIHNDSSSRPII